MENLLNDKKVENINFTDENLNISDSLAGVILIISDLRQACKLTNDEATLTLRNYYYYDTGKHLRIDQFKSLVCDDKVNKLRDKYNSQFKMQQKLHKEFNLEDLSKSFESDVNTNAEDDVSMLKSVKMKNTAAQTQSDTTEQMTSKTTEQTLSKTTEQTLSDTTEQMTSKTTEQTLSDTTEQTQNDTTK